MAAEAKYDDCNIQCPYCGKLNDHVLVGLRVEPGKPVHANRKCRHCHRVVHYIGEMVIMVRALEAEEGLAVATDEPSQVTQ